MSTTDPLQALEDDDLRPVHSELIPSAAHGLNEDGEVKVTPPGCETTAGIRLWRGVPMPTWPSPL